MNQSEHELQDVMDKLATLEPTDAEAPRPTRALAHMQQRLQTAEEAHWSRRFRRFFTPAPTRRPAFAVAALALALLVAFSFPAVRAAAGEFLGLFRVETFTAVSISPEQMALFRQLASEGLSPGEVTILQEPGRPTAVNSLADAGALTGLTPRTITALDGPTAVSVVDGGAGYLTIDLDGARAILAATGSDPLLLPDSLDGARINLTAFPGIEQQWADGTWLLQTESPTVEYPVEVANPTILAEALLRALGLDAAEAQRLAQEIDWTSTLLLPLPADVIAFQEVSVDGVSGLALQNLEGITGALIWQKNGVIYLLQSDASLEGLLALAASLD